MFSVYILRSQQTKRYYVGSTQDATNRVAEHNGGESLSTRTGIPWQLVHVEEFSSRSEALQQERKIKSRGIARYLQNLAK